MQIRFIIPTLFLFLLGLVWNESSADEKARKPSPEEGAIRKAAAQYREALKRGDAAALAAAWTTDGDYVDASGNVFKARDLIKKQFPAGSQPGGSESPEIANPASTLRLISPDVALEDGVAEIHSAEQEEPVRGRYAVIWKKEGGKWLIDSVRETTLPPSASAATPPTDARLTELAWLIGDWVGSSGKLTYEVSAKFLEEDRVVERRFTMRQDDRIVLAGAEFITRDPTTGEITAQSISSHGSHDEAVWTVDENVWTVEAVGVMSDGQSLETTSVYAPHEDGTITWSVLEASVEGHELPEFSVKFSRKPAK